MQGMYMLSCYSQKKLVLRPSKILDSNKHQMTQGKLLQFSPIT